MVQFILIPNLPSNINVQQHRVKTESGTFRDIVEVSLSKALRLVSQNGSLNQNKKEQPVSQVMDPNDSSK